MIPDYYREPTNSAGITTLFEHRNWTFCLKHDKEYRDSCYPICWTCWREEQIEIQNLKKEKRISEMTEAIKRSKIKC